MVLPDRLMASHKSNPAFLSNSKILAQTLIEYDERVASYQRDSEASLARLRASKISHLSFLLAAITQPVIFPSKEAFRDWDDCPRSPKRMSPTADIQPATFPSDDAFNDWRTNCQLPNKLLLPSINEAPSLFREPIVNPQINTSFLPIWSNVSQLCCGLKK